MAEGSPKKKVAYLFGAGATHAELKREDSSKSLRMRDVNRKVMEEIEKENEDGMKEFLNQFSNVDPEKRNVEHIISLMESLETHENREIANKLRRVFQAVIIKETRIQSRYVKPSLTEALLTMHSLESIKNMRP